MHLLVLLALAACAGAEPAPAALPAPVPPRPVVDDTPLSLHPSCPGTVAELPESPLFDREDPRLQGKNVIVALKEEREIMLYQDGSLAQGACWQMGLAPGSPSGTKTRRGDLATPEGWYRTSDKPWSRYYHAIAVHYPNASDAERGARAGQITEAKASEIAGAIARDQKPDQTTKLGGEILIHGGGGGDDWTLGCLAMDDDEIDALRAHLDGGFRVDMLILP